MLDSIFNNLLDAAWLLGVVAAQRAYRFNTIPVICPYNNDKRRNFIDIK